MPIDRSKTLLFYYARILRHNLTPAEKTLWYRLRSHRLAGAGFRRQHLIDRYIADFCAPRERIIIELDGGHHANQREYDAARTAFFEERGFTVMRFWNNEVMNNIDGVMEEILKFISNRNEAIESDFEDY